MNIYIYIIYIYDMFMCALIDNLQHGLEFTTFQHVLHDFDVLAAMMHFVFGLLWIGEVLAIYPLHLIHVEGCVLGEERVRGWEGSEGGGGLNIQSPSRLYKAPTDNTKPQHATQKHQQTMQSPNTIYTNPTGRRGGGRGMTMSYTYIYTYIYINYIYIYAYSICPYQSS